MPAKKKEEEAKAEAPSKATGELIRIIVTFLNNGREEVNAVELKNDTDVIALRNAIKAAFAKGLADYDASQLVVRSPNAAAEPLKNPREILASAVKRDATSGDWEVYVEVPAKKEAGCSVIGCTQTEEHKHHLSDLPLFTYCTTCGGRNGNHDTPECSGLWKPISEGMIEVLGLFRSIPKPAHKGPSPVVSRNSTPSQRGSTPATVEECAICKEPLTEGLKMLQCRHEFHGECVRVWFEQPIGKNQCPLCRRVHNSPTLHPVQPVAGADSPALPPTPDVATPQTPSPSFTPDNGAAFQTALRAARITILLRRQRQEQP